VQKELTEPLVAAYRLLYLIAKQEGDVRTSLDYHEKYAAADKRYLDDIGARELAFQMATHEATANRLQIDALAKQNQVLQLQRALGDKAVENGRLYIVLLVSTLIFMAALVYRTKRLQLHFKRLSQRDGLTGIFNRHHFIERAEIALDDCRKMGQSACVLLFDVDHFKAVNDKFGHAAGDAVLAAAAAACKSKLDVGDIFGRLGGEEFGILISDATIEDGHRRAEQLRAVLADMPTRSGEAAIHISASFGVAASTQSGFELRQLMADADAALYRAKNAGRNRVVVFASTEPYVVLN
jgi:diguanylate cyclase (GGDEF)-like protein